MEAKKRGLLTEYKHTDTHKHTQRPEKDAKWQQLHPRYRMRERAYGGGGHNEPRALLCGVRPFKFEIIKKREHNEN